MLADELFEEVYKLLRGSQAASALVEAKALYAEEKFVECATLLESTLKRYALSREAKLNKELPNAEDVKSIRIDKETTRQVRKQSKANDVLEQLQELIERVRRSIRTSNAMERPNLDAVSSTNPGQNPIASTGSPGIDPIDALREDFLQATSFDERQDAINHHCEIRSIEAVADIRAGDLLQVLSEGKHHLLLVETPAVQEGALRVRSAIDGSRLKPLAMDRVNLSIERSKMLKLVPRVTNTRPKTTAVEKASEIKQLDVQPMSQEFVENASKLSIQERDQIIARYTASLEAKATG